ncbi:MAG: AAA family ATPase, partial [Proteobacteria bacterium]|nr:AAA family ATPase [Pseudomonadota bacterium]
SVLGCQYLYINASDENGIDTIRTKVSAFAQTKSIDGKVKVIILDECDGMTPNSQQALRNTMETFSQYTRFILTANFKHKIIAPLQSRCQSLTLKPNLEQAVKRCYTILKTENITVDDDQKKKFVDLVKNFFPDLRKTINELQKSVIDGRLQVKSSTVNYQLIVEMFKHLQSGDSLGARKLIIQSEEEFQGDYQALLKETLSYVYDQSFEDRRKKELILIIAEHLYRSTFCVDGEINYFACLIQLEKTLSS